MKLWVDDVRPMPIDYKAIDCEHAYSVEDAINIITYWERKGYDIDLIDLDHDAGYYAKYGGDYIRILDWLEETGRNYPIRIHSMNPVGVENMRRIIQRNGWTEVK